MRRSLPILLIAAAALASCSKDRDRSHERRVVILGIDGMDYKMTKRLMEEGKLPNLKKLAEKGGFSSLRTTDPPQSPVAWSTFITGLNPSDHGIYDFVHRDPATMSPYLSTSRVEEVDCVFAIGDYALQTCSPEMLSLRRGKPFWEYLEENGVPASIYKIPANFPTDEKWTTETISGMGTPDVMGTYGTFQLVTNAPAFKDKKISGGMVRMASKEGSKYTGSIAGPPDPTTVTETELSVPIEVLANNQKVGVVQLADRDFLLGVGEWTSWIPIVFEPTYGGSVPGMVRLHLRSLDPLELYVSPVNINPDDPIMPISSPDGFSQEFAKKQGLYYTQGMPEDTKALSGGVLSDEAFLRQADIVFEERIRMMRAALDRYEGGLLFFYFSSVDQVAHMFWRAQSMREGDELYKYRDVVLKKYLRVDEIIGEVMEKLGDDTDLIVMSDHGFANYVHKVNLNTWLLEKGYLALREDGSHGGGPLGHIDWERTQAYALGLNQLFINKRGREANGVIDPAQATNIISRLKSDLERWRDPNTGRRVVRDVVEPGSAPDDGVAPDLIVGYARGYRSSDGSAMGEIKDEVVEPNTEHWNGDHCMASDLVPGVLFSSRKIGNEDPGLNDFAPSILEDFGVAVPDNLPGKSLHKPSKKED